MKQLFILLSIAALACGMQTTLPKAAKIAEIPTQPPTVEIYTPHMMQVCEDRTMPVYDEPDGELTGQVFGYLDTFEAVYVNADWLYLTQGGYIEADYICEWTAVEVTPVVMQGMITADTLYVRQQASTSADVLKPALVRFQVVNIGAMVKNKTVDCQNWYPLIDRPGFICADFVKIQE